MINESLSAAIEEFLASATEEEERGRYRSAVTLYFKAIAIACDSLIFKKIRKISSSHTERFRLLELHFPKIYPRVSEAFKYYTDTYSKNITKEHCEKVKGVLREILKFGRFEKTV